MNPRVAAGWVTLAALAPILGCGLASSPPTSPDALPRAVAAVESHAEDVLTALETGDAVGASDSIPRLRETVAGLTGLGPAAGLDTAATVRLDNARSELESAFDEIDALLADGSRPTGIDAATIRAKVESALSGIRDTLPAGVIAELQRFAKRRPQPLRAPSETFPQGDDAFTPPPEPTDPADTPADPGQADTPAEPPLTERSRPVAEFAARTGGRNSAARMTLASSSSRQPAAPLYPSVLMVDEASWRLAPERVARCGEIVREFPAGERWAQLVPTLHAVVNRDRTLAAYGRMIDRGESWTDRANLRAASDSDDLVGRVRSEFAAAVRLAVARGLHLAVTPHLDPAGGPHEEWRNEYRFGPRDAIDGHDYASLLLEPIADALVGELTPDTRVDVALSGEMGRSLFERPREWLVELRRLRVRIAREPRCTGVALGVALNWSDIAGGADHGSVDRESLAQLFAECDFVGYSCYAPVGVPPTASDFARATQGFLAELAEWGVDLRPDQRLIISEVGLGGGVPTRTRVRATSSDREAARLVWPTLEEIAGKPYEGRGDGRFNPWADPARRELRRQYHAALRDYLATPTSAGEKQVERAFLWSEGPWDPQGVTDNQFVDAAIAGAAGSPAE